MKKCVAAVLAVILAMNLAACQKTKHDAYAEIYKRYNEMKTFYAHVEIVVKNARTENVYEAKQYYAAPNRFSIEFEKPEELSGSGYSFNDGKIRLKSGIGKEEKLSAAYKMEDSSIFITDFLEAYYKSEDAFVETSSDGEGEITVFNRYTGDGNRSFFKQRLSFDNNTFLPIRLETFDVDGNPTVTVIYKEFKRDCEIDNKVFE